MNNNLKEDQFSFYVPIQVIEKADKDGKVTERLIEGIASTEDLDLQGEIVKQTGIETGYFLKNGWINNDHLSGPDNKIGVPVECKSTKAGLWIKAKLLKDHAMADKWWEFLTSLDASGAKRTAGFSIQGKVTRRNGKSIVGCWLSEVALTANPVNTETYAQICKSLAQEKFCDHPWIDLDKSCSCCPPDDPDCLCKVEHLDNKEEKALTAGGMGGVLVPQSLEGSPKVTTYKSQDMWSAQDAIDYLVKDKKYTENTAKAIVNFIMTEGK